MAEAITARGGAVHEHTRALKVDDDARTVDTDRGTITAGDIVVATHQPFPKDGAYFARAEPWRSYAIAVRVAGAVPDGMYISTGDSTRSVRNTAAGLVIVGGEGHKVGHETDTGPR